MKPADNKNNCTFFTFSGQLVEWVQFLFQVHSAENLESLKVPFDVDCYSDVG